MRASIGKGFDHFSRLCDPGVNAALLAALAAHADTPKRDFVRANLLRRIGDLVGARAAFGRWIESAAAPAGVRLDTRSVVPTGAFSSGGFAIAPLVCIDGFLPPERMAALLAHASAREEHFRRALATNEVGPPSYDPDRRETMLDFGFTLERGNFVQFVESNLSRLCDSLGLPPFTIDRIELKLTNHLNGGFFKAHNDNHAAYCETGRAITWLYYFGQEQRTFAGGELYLFDSKPGAERLSPAWFTRIDPQPNRLIAFPSWFYHAVAPTALVENAFARGRFAVSSHVRKDRDSHKAWWEINNVD